jgi:cyclic dehypoxanthinyl futalosine synthase
VKIAAAPFLNTKPLIQGLDVEFCSPSEGARRLAESLVDIALLPVAAFARQGDLVAAPGICIGAKNEVGSVLVVADRPLEELKTIALDASSRSSVALLRILLDAKGLKPKFEVRQAPTENALIIGDRALQAKGKYVYDLAAEWRKLTGLPFVFAVWAWRPSKDDEERSFMLRRSMERGQEQLDQIADASGVLGARKYLRENLCFRLDDELLAGAAEFLRRGSALGLFPETAKLRLVGDAPPTVDVPERLEAAARGARLSAYELSRIGEEAELLALGGAADRRRRLMNPTAVVTYIIDRNINYTNVCTTACRFCAFFRNPGEEDAYVLSRETLGQKIQETVDAGGIQILLQGGLNPELRIEWYEELFRHLKSSYPIKLHALSPEEILHLCRLEDLDIEQVLRRLVAAGLDSLPGGGAEMLTETVRNKIAKLKCSGEEWLEVMRVAHRLGLSSTATMMFAVGESWAERVEHMLKIRDLQDEAHGFTAFICWPFQPGNTRLPGADGSAHSYLRTLALSRLALDNVPHLQASWPTMGPAVGQAALHFGADDFGSVMFEENVVSSAGTVFKMDADGIERHVRAAGFQPRRRNMRYEGLT